MSSATSSSVIEAIGAIRQTYRVTAGPDARRYVFSSWYSGGLHGRADGSLG